tara:strand:- start:1148 stop:1459 length:312 start_codon:yes stop_codon:yes gene_type:complete
MVSTTMKELCEAVIRDGPKIAKVIKGPSRTAVQRIAYYWPILISTPAERRWAKERIVTDVKTIHPLVLKWLIELLVAAIIKWFFTQRSHGLNRLMCRLRHEML